MTPETIHQALETLGLPPLITREDIRRRYRALARTHHPDRTGDAEIMERINAAYALLMEYVETFRYRFDADEIAQHYPEGEHAQKFRI